MKINSEIEVNLNLAKGTPVVFHPTVEYSADCPVCRRINRPFILKHGESEAYCEKGKHSLSAEIFQIEVSENKAVYRIKSEYEDFSEIRQNIASGKSVRTASQKFIRWVRIYFKVICLNCGEEAEHTTQHGLATPHSFHCRCGQHLYTETNETASIMTTCIE